MEELEHIDNGHIFKLFKPKGGNNKVAKTTGSPVFTWSTHSYTLDHITNNFKLPRVVKCSVGSCCLDWDLLHFDLSQPLLLHSLRTVKKVKAAVMRLDNGELTETGSYVVIPVDYKGWFTRLDNPLEKYLPSSTLESVVDKDEGQVLVANSISCLCLTETGEGRQQERRLISSGEILHIKRTDDSDTLGQTSPSTKYLVCTDEKEKEIYLPSSQSGKFYKVKNSFESNGLFQIHDLIDKQQNFPINIRHVIGEMPVFSSEYTSYLRCFGIIEETTAVACTMDDDLVLLELQIQTPLKFYMALNESSAKTNIYYSGALQNCETDGDDYVRSIKFSFTLSPDSYSVCNSLLSIGSYQSTESYYNDSEIGDEDANSEFTIKWDPAEEQISNVTQTKTPVPKIFNSSINQPNKQVEEKWNDEPDTV